MNRETILNAYTRAAIAGTGAAINYANNGTEEELYKRRSRQYRTFRARLLRKCKWTPHKYYNMWKLCTDVAHGDPSRKNWAFCPYCGGELEVEE